MRITRRTTLPGSTGAENAGAVAPSASAGSRTVEASADDTVNLSEAARLRQRLRVDLGDVGRVDTARVTRLHGEVGAATYRPAADAVAKSLLGDLAADLLV